jgi:hypothetical protein
MKLLYPAFRVMSSYEKRYYQAESHAIAYNSFIALGFMHVACLKVVDSSMFITYVFSNQMV